MSVTRRVISESKIDDYIPQAETCMICKSEIDLSTCHYGRVVTGWINTEKNSLKHLIRDNQVLQVPIVDVQYFPKKVKGNVCISCHEVLWNTTWYDKNNHLRRAFEAVLPQVEQPLGDDYEAASVTKGLYAPHGKTGSSKSAVIDESRPQKEHLDGFRRRR